MGLLLAHVALKRNHSHSLLDYQCSESPCEKVLPMKLVDDFIDAQTTIEILKATHNVAYGIIISSNLIIPIPTKDFSTCSVFAFMDLEEYKTKYKNENDLGEYENEILTIEEIYNRVMKKNHTNHQIVQIWKTKDTNMITHVAVSKELTIGKNKELAALADCYFDEQVLKEAKFENAFDERPTSFSITAVEAKLIQIDKGEYDEFWHQINHELFNLNT